MNAYDALVGLKKSLETHIATASQLLGVLNTQIATLESATLESATLESATPGSPPPAAPSAPFRPVSLAFNKSMSKESRHAEGIYFTPRIIRRRLFEVLDHLAVRPTSILEPCFGTGEFIHDAREKYASVPIVGVEKNTALFQSCSAPGVTVVNADFLQYKSDTQFDLIIGNPPYFVTKAKDPACMTGRGNIYVQFIYKCLTSHLSDGGVLAFVLPTSFYNCAYYEPCRKYMARHTDILHIETLDSAEFHDTAQDTMLMIVRRVAANSSPAFQLELGGRMVFTPRYKELRALCESTTTLAQLGFEVKTGEVVWNQHKTELHASAGVPVLYASNIVHNRIVMDNLLGTEKKQYIQFATSPPPAAQTGPAIVVARGYGNTYKMSYARVPDAMAFYGENHVNVITPKTAAAVDALPRVLASLADPRTEQFVAMYVGNGALSKTELEHVLPIF